MRYDHAERVGELLAQLRARQALLAERQRQLLQAVAADQPRQDRLCQEVRALSEQVMVIIEQMGQEVREEDRKSVV